MGRNHTKSIDVGVEAPWVKEESCDSPAKVIHILEDPTHIVQISYKTRLD
jgi:hypothetical protein